jgi:hypothetical protein
MKPEESRPWTSEDDDLLRLWYAKESTRKAAARLNRTLDATYARARKLGLRKKRIEARAGNAEPIGTIRKHGRQGYFFIKVAEGSPWGKVWKRLHYVVWEAANGPLPDTHVLTFKDGNVENTALENLEPVPKQDWNKRYTPEHTLPAELAGLIRLKAALVRQINKRTKKGKNERE